MSSALNCLLMPGTGKSHGFKPIEYSGYSSDGICFWSSIGLLKVVCAKAHCLGTELIFPAQDRAFS
jgi:hypothetical protein